MGFAPHAQLLHYEPRRHVLGLTRRNQPMAAKRAEGEVEQRPGGFGCIATTLVAGRDGPPDFVRGAAEPRVKDHVANKLTRLARDDGDGPRGPPCVLPGESLRLRLVQ